MWKKVKGHSQPSFFPSILKKKMLKLDYEFVVDILNKIVESKQSGTDDISDKKMRMLCALLENYLVDWSRVIFAFLVENIQTGVSLTTRWIVKVLGYGFMLSAILRDKKVKLRIGTASHRTHYHMTSKPPNYLKRKADELEAALRKEQKKSKSKSSKSSVGQGEPKMAKGHGSEGSTHQPKTQPEPSKPQASKHAESSKRTESSSEKEPEKSSKKRKAGSLEAAQKRKSKKHKSKRSKSSAEKDLTEVSEGHKTEGKKAESSHEEKAKASKEVTKKRKAKQLKRPKKKPKTAQTDEVKVEHETQSTAVLPAEAEPKEAHLEVCHRVLPPPLDLSREDSDEEDQMPLTRLMKPTTPQIEPPSTQSALESLPPPEPLVTEPESPIAPMPRTQQLVITLPRERNESGTESTMIEDDSEGDDADIYDQSYRPMSAIVQRQITAHLSPFMAHIMLTLDYIHRHIFLQWPRV